MQCLTNAFQLMSFAHCIFSKLVVSISSLGGDVLGVHALTSRKDTVHRAVWSSPGRANEIKVVKIRLQHGRMAS